MQVGDLSASQGRPVTMPVSAATAVVDIRSYIEQLESVFPPSALYYPADSIRRLKVARATAWVQRLQASSTHMTGRELLAFADVAIQAEQDTIAQRAFDQRLHELADGRPVDPGMRSATVERSLTLMDAVMAFSDPTYDPARLVRDRPIARAYLKQLQALPDQGYTIRNDSTVVADRKMVVVIDPIMKYAYLAVDGDSLMTSMLLEYLDTGLTLLSHKSGADRTGSLTNAIPWSAVSLAVLHLPNGRARLAAIRARIDSLVTFRPGEFAELSPERRAAKQAYVRQMIADRFAFAERIVNPLPSITAHVWLNTPDSVYDSVPRTHPFDDGRIHVMILGKPSAPRLTRLDRIQRKFAGKVQMLYVMETEGYTGPDVVDGPTEAAWLATYFRDVRHLTIPIAIWVGKKVRGENGTSMPIPSPSMQAYKETGLTDLQSFAIIIDGRGRLIAYRSLEDSIDEMRLVESIRRVLTVPQS